MAIQPLLEVSREVGLAPLSNCSYLLESFLNAQQKSVTKYCYSICILLLGTTHNLLENCYHITPAQSSRIVIEDFKVKQKWAFH